MTIYFLYGLAVGVGINVACFVFGINLFFVFLLKISSVEDDELMVVKFFHNTRDKGFVMINFEYTIARKDV